jgi:DNA-binding NtrC family response regulator/tetratricopeptide (TPR) repeat protein
MGRVYLNSDSYSDALAYFVRAEENALRSDMTDAELASLYVDIAACHLGLGRHDKARSYIAQVEELELGSEHDEIRAEAGVVLARTEVKAGRFRKSLVAADRAYALLRKKPDSPLLAEASKVLGTAHAELGNSTGARDCFVDCLVCNRRLGNDEGMAGAYNNLGILAKRSGDLASAIDYFERALEIDRRLGRPASIARRLNNLGVALYRMSRWSEAETSLRKALEIYAGLGAARDVVSVESALGNVCRVRRDWEAARRHFTSALNASREAGYLRAEALALEFLGDLEKDMGDYPAALELLDQALVCAGKLSSKSDVVGEVLRRRAEVCLALGRLDDAERDCTEALNLCREIHDRLEEGSVLRVLAALSYARGNRSVARSMTARAADILARTGETYELAMTAFTDGEGLRLSGDVDEDTLERIEERLSTAEELFDGAGAGYWVARSRLERARAQAKAGLLVRSRMWLDAARREFARAGEAGGLSDVDTLAAELDDRLIDAAEASEARYSVIAAASARLHSGSGDPETLHSFSLQACDAACADRLVLFRKTREGDPRIVMSVGRTGRRLAEVKRFVRSVAEDRPRLTPLVATSGGTKGHGVPSAVQALALLPMESASSGDMYLLYADRLKGGTENAFDSGTIEFLAAALRILSLIHSRSAGAGTAEMRDSSEDARGDVGTGFLTRDPHMVRALSSLDRLSGSSIPVMIAGDSGVGKDVLARVIHEAGGSGPFVALNSGAIPKHLQESELFGHVKGAFTDADRDREGLIESAADGTLFLDEIGEMSPELQVKLLRFLQSGEYRRVGDSAVRKSNARVVSASNRNLLEEVKKGRFRRDLYYRLSAYVIEIPPLRERPADIPLLMQHFLSVYSQLEGKDVPGFTNEVAELFRVYHWRGNNVRELENEVRRGVALCGDGQPIGLEHLSPALSALRVTGAGPRRAASVATDAPSLRDEVEALERSRIEEALELSADSKPEAAERLGLSRTGLYTKMRKYGLE